MAQVFRIQWNNGISDDPGGKNRCEASYTSFPRLSIDGIINNV